MPVFNFLLLRPRSSNSFNSTMCYDPTSARPIYRITSLPHQFRFQQSNSNPPQPDWGSYSSSGGAFSWGSSFPPPPISFSWGPPLILFTEQLRPPPPPVLGIRYVGERRRGGAEGAWVEKKKSEAETIPQWSDKNNTIKKHLGAIRERMPLLGEYSMAEYIEEQP